MAASIRKIGDLMGKESDPDLQSMLSAAFVRLSTRSEFQQTVWGAERTLYRDGEYLEATAGAGD